MKDVRNNLEDEGGFSLPEALISSMILGFGLLAVAGLSMSTAQQRRLAERRTDQALTAQLEHSKVQQALPKLGFSSITDTERSLAIGDRTFVLSTKVSLVSSRVKEVQVEVSRVGSVGSRTFTTRVYDPRQLPGPVQTSASPPPPPPPPPDCTESGKKKKKDDDDCDDG